MKLNRPSNQRMMIPRCLAFLVSALVVSFSVILPALAESRLELEEAEITGARELPKVLYIVPWKKTQPGERTPGFFHEKFLFECLKNR